VSDGWSMGVLVREFAALYGASCAGELVPLPELPVQYGDYAVWQRQWLRGEVLEARLAYWQERLADLPLLELPTDRSRPAVQTFRGAQQTFGLSAPLSQALTALSRQQGVTLFMTLLAAFQTLLAYASGHDDIAVGTDVANRTRVETEGLIGFFVNQLVLRTDVAGDPSFTALLGRVREVCLGAYAHQDLPFDTLVGVLKAKRDLSRAPLFQVKLNLQNAPPSALELPNLTLSPLEFDVDVAHLDLALHLVSTGRELAGSLVYNTDLFSAGTAHRMLRQFDTLLGRVVQQPEATVAELKEILREGDRQQKIAEAKERREANLQKLKTVRRKAVGGPHPEGEDTDLNIR